MYTLNGTGTRLYGSVDKNVDGSYITTKWIVFFFIPLIPLGSYRVWPEKNILEMPGNTTMVINNEPRVKNTFFGTERSFRMQKVSWNWKQIRNVYITAIVIILSMYLIGLLFSLLG